MGAESVDARRTFSGVEELLTYVGCTTLDGLSDYFADDLDSDVVIADAADDCGSAAIEITLLEYGRGVVEPFPLSIEEIWNDLYDIEAECQVPDHLESLAEEVELVEGFEVEVELDDGVSDEALLDSIGRRMTAGGCLVQYVHTITYPYRRRMSGSATVADWLSSRFFKHCPGIRVSLRGDRTTTLAQLRLSDNSRTWVHFGMEDDPGSSSPRRSRVVPRAG